MPQKFNKNAKEKLEIVDIDGEQFLKISNSNTIRPFFMSIVSPYNHWMFLSSNGGLTAGRRNAEYALFPYYTDDKITEAADTTGSKTIIKINQDKQTLYWEPFAKRFSDQYTLTRNIYKNFYGNKIIFEEINEDLKLKYTYRFSSSDQFGFVKDARISNLKNDYISVEVIDGLQNILPASVNSDLQMLSSNLVDAYKRNELHQETGMGIYALSAVPVDKAEPSEALKANIAWSIGIKNPLYLVSSLQLEQFRNGYPLQQEEDIKAEKGAYFVHQNLHLEANTSKQWKIIADVNYDHSQLIAIINSIKNDTQLNQKIQDDIIQSTQELIHLNASADGLQFSSDKLRDIRHYSNTLYNIMRGGIFDNNYTIDQSDFSKYIQKANKTVYQKYATTIQKLGDNFNLELLKKELEKHKDNDFSRLSYEYLPLKFSRRHGDPSRPWNKFSINTKDEDGNKILDYEGNWRDIFQNWESLAYSYPEFVKNMIYKFLNASTFDGYNPYRVTKDGFDWETIEPDDPWSYIGYWGDHQIIYLLKFLELSDNIYPSSIAKLFNTEHFVYANVPYKIKPYQDILNDPKDTIDFDINLDAKIRKQRDKLGADGALLKDANGNIVHVNFIEKILATTLAKISNFIPEAGIWMNTQRPEWNDANNALVGNGVSVVTLCYLRRFLAFFDQIFSQLESTETYSISIELYILFSEINTTLQDKKYILTKGITDQDRKDILDRLSGAASTYRCNIYRDSFSGQKKSIQLGELQQFTNNALQYLEQTIDANKRQDNLYHAYNLMTVTDGQSITISYLEEMLEGQVAVLSSKYLTSNQSKNLLDGLKNSTLFREDQYSYMLYPNKKLKGFLDRNTIPESLVQTSNLLQKLVTDKHNKIIEKDENNSYHFHRSFNNNKKLKQALKQLKNTKYKTLVEKEYHKVLSIYEKVFNHKAFTGRSGTFYGYEGLGSIYWHMVSKLQLAVLETSLHAISNNENPETTGRLLEHYYEINEGIGVHKSPSLYGAFSTDPYSHTPFGKGAQQPGMTGQVKEDILSRFGELGVVLDKGYLSFNPNLLRKDEFLKISKTIQYKNIDFSTITLEIPKNSISFTYCQVPIIYTIAGQNQIEITKNNGQTLKIEGLKLTKVLSKSIFKRKGEILKIQILVDKTILK